MWKSTVLQMIAGLEGISSGKIYIDKKPVNDVLPKDCDISMVFRSYPHMSVLQNMAYGLKLRKTPRDEMEARGHKVAPVLAMEHLLERNPKAPPGGKR